MPSGTAPTGDSRIRLQVPALHAFGGLTPLTASGLAERAGFDAEEIERVVRAVGHTVEALVDGVASDGGVLDIEFVLAPGRLVVDLATAVRPEPGEAGLSPADWRRLDRRVAPLVNKVEPIVGGARISFGADRQPS